MRRVPSVKTRLLLVDDHELFAQGLRYILENLSNDISVVDVAPDGKRALEIAKHESIDVVLMDVRMPIMDGVEATKLFQILHPSVRIIMLTTFDDDDYVHMAIEHGAAGYLLKSIRPEDLLNAIRAVMSGQLLFDGKLHALAGLGSPNKDDFKIAVENLTPREREVLELILESKSNRQIGADLGISDHSVRNYVSNIYLEFGVNDRFELIQHFNEEDPRRNPE